jgi:signal transduction histidine kinase
MVPETLHMSVTEDREKERLIEEVKSLREKLARLKLAESERKRAGNQLRLLQDINNAMNRGTPLDHVLQMAAEGVREIFDYAACDIYLLENNHKNLRYAALSIDSHILGLIEKLTGLTALGLRIPLTEESSFADVIEKKRLWITDDMVKVFEGFTDNKRLKLLAGQAARLSRFRSVIRVPLIAEDEVLGIIGAASKKGITDEDGEVLERFASQMALAIKKGQAEEALKKAYQELKSLDEMKNNIIANITHELRTPITIALTSLELAITENDSQARERALRLGIKALHRQNRIVQDLLEVARKEKKELEINVETIDINDVAFLAVEEMLPAAGEKGIKINLDLPNIWVKADLEKIRHVLLNLLDNALKFTEQGGNINISARVKGDMAVVCVEDNGIGIGEEFHGKIFDRLYQVDATSTRRFGGTGMGLAVAKEVINTHGGIIWVESEKGKGSKFYFTLPISTDG